MNVEELLEQYAADQREFSGLNLSGVNLPGVNLSRSTFAQANFNAAKLTNSDFSNSSCEYAKFHGAKLTLSDFSHANLQHADLSHAELTRADFSAGDLRSANLSYADLRDAKLRGSNLNAANLSRADLRYANLISATLQGANLTNSELSSTDLSGADLRWAELRQATLNRANLQGANLRGANLRWADLSGANLRWADLTGAKLSGANLTGADLSHAILLDATLVHVDLSRSNLAHVDWAGADLSGSNLTGAKLYAVSPFGVKTAGATCRWIDLSQNGDQSQIYQFISENLSEYFHESPPIVELVIDDRLSSDAHCALAVAYQQLARQKNAIVPPQIEVHKRRTILRFALDRDEDLFSTAFIAILPFTDAKVAQSNLLHLLKSVPLQEIDDSIGIQAFQVLVKVLSDSIQKIDRSKLVQAIPTAIQKIRFFQAPTRLMLSNSAQRSLAIYENPLFGKRRIQYSPEAELPFLNQPISFVLPSQSEVIEFLQGFQARR
ncbi:pentapeptide repeat-containing protein [Leptolyngbya boryana CZ1]|uniref:Pentapeptide repeat-containing protein n=1 Tax=Leptolyngbya boryana CZ1 TaxID=3060204 RepID=A0AA97AWL5_LEPBY|nr:pentapeptide repeat-containing protein [Leptolyngbya boryana]WNZ48415.1 pentapeptide repeat-containing protein [Leptolyngbya boryana CZ1]